MHMANPTRRWTIADLDSFPEDGNTYELIRGQLFVTPPPTDPHETIAARLTRILDPYVAAHGLGLVYHPRAVIQIDDDTQLEPDLMVRQPQDVPNAKWVDAPLPSLVVEIASDSTRRRDRVHKRTFYLDVGVPEYWIVDGSDRTIRVVRRGEDDVVVRDVLAWRPRGATTALKVELEAVFGPPADHP